MSGEEDVVVTSLTFQPKKIVTKVLGKKYEDTILWPVMITELETPEYALSQKAEMFLATKSLKKNYKPSNWMVTSEYVERVPEGLKLKSYETRSPFGNVIVKPIYDIDKSTIYRVGDLVSYTINETKNVIVSNIKETGSKLKLSLVSEFDKEELVIDKSDVLDITDDENPIITFSTPSKYFGKITGVTSEFLVLDHENKTLKMPLTQVSKCDDGLNSAMSELTYSEGKNLDKYVIDNAIKSSIDLMFTTLCEFFNVPTEISKYEVIYAINNTTNEKEKEKYQQLMSRSKGHGPRNDVVKLFVFKQEMEDMVKKIVEKIESKFERNESVQHSSIYDIVERYLTTPQGMSIFSHDLTDKAMDTIIANTLLLKEYSEEKTPKKKAKEDELYNNYIGNLSTEIANSNPDIEEGIILTVADMFINSISSSPQMYSEEERMKEIELITKITTNIHNKYPTFDLMSIMNSAIKYRNTKTGKSKETFETIVGDVQSMIEFSKLANANTQLESLEKQGVIQTFDTFFKRNVALLAYDTANFLLSERDVYEPFVKPYINQLTDTDIQETLIALTMFEAHKLFLFSLGQTLSSRDGTVPRSVLLLKEYNKFIKHTQTQRDEFMNIKGLDDYKKDQFGEYCKQLIDLSEREIQTIHDTGADSNFLQYLQRFGKTIPFRENIPLCAIGYRVEYSLVYALKQMALKIETYKTYLITSFKQLYALIKNIDYDDNVKLENMKVGINFNNLKENVVGTVQSFSNGNILSSLNNNILDNTIKNTTDPNAKSILIALKDQNIKFHTYAVNASQAFINLLNNKLAEVEELQAQAKIPDIDIEGKIYLHNNFFDLLKNASVITEVSLTKKYLKDYIKYKTNQLSDGIFNVQWSVGTAKNTLLYTEQQILNLVKECNRKTLSSSFRFIPIDGGILINEITLRNDNSLNFEKQFWEGLSNTAKNEYYSRLTDYIYNVFKTREQINTVFVEDVPFDIYFSNGTFVVTPQLSNNFPPINTFFKDISQGKADNLIVSQQQLVVDKTNDVNDFKKIADDIVQIDAELDKYIGKKLLKNERDAKIKLLDDKHKLVKKAIKSPYSTDLVTAFKSVYKFNSTGKESTNEDKVVLVHTQETTNEDEDATIVENEETQDDEEEEEDALTSVRDEEEQVVESENKLYKVQPTSKYETLFEAIKNSKGELEKELFVLLRERNFKGSVELSGEAYDNFLKKFLIQNYKLIPQEWKQFKPKLRTISRVAELETNKNIENNLKDTIFRYLSASKDNSVQGRTYIVEYTMTNKRNYLIDHLKHQLVNSAYSSQNGEMERYFKKIVEEQTPKIKEEYLKLFNEYFSQYCKTIGYLYDFCDNFKEDVDDIDTAKKLRETVLTTQSRQFIDTNNIDLQATIYNSTINFVNDTVKGSVNLMNSFEKIATVVSSLQSTDLFVFKDFLLGDAENILDELSLFDDKSFYPELLSKDPSFYKGYSLIDINSDLQYSENLFRKSVSENLALILNQDISSRLPILPSKRKRINQLVKYGSIDSYSIKNAFNDKDQIIEKRIRYSY